MALYVNIWKVVSEKAKIVFFDDPLSFDAPSPANPRKYGHKPYRARITISGLLTLWVYLHSNFSGELRKTCVM